jgi:sugar phosphate isomerase/epimerase
MAGGALNGYFVAGLGLTTILVTSATLLLFKGMSLIITKGESITGAPDAIMHLGNGKLFGVVPYLFILLIACYLAVGAFLSFTSYGEQCRLLGAGVKIAALTCHVNPVHPNAATAKRHDDELSSTILLAEKLDVSTVVTYSGCPGSRTSSHPTWVVGVWPLDNLQLSEYQWDEVLIPYWTAKASFAKSHGVNVAIEMAGGYSVHNPRTLLRLREACGETIGAAFDPAALIWQGADCNEAIDALVGAIVHFHARDCHIDKRAMGRNGFFSPSTSPGNDGHPYEYRIAGNGMGRRYWTDMMYALRRAGYEGQISVRYEDASVGRSEGVAKAVGFLSNIVIGEGDASN